MKKLLTLSLLVLLCASGFAQQVVLVFTGQDATTNQYVQLSRIEITDLTQGWTENLYYPDTMAILTVGTGIAENAANGVFGLSQNNPNPFNGTTDVNLTVADPGEVAMEITDANGRLIVAQNTAIANPGTHRFRVNVAATGIYFLTARQNGKTSSVKMVNNGNGTGNGIEYAGTVIGTQNFASQQTKNGTKGAINHAFAYGDAMTYQGFAIVNGEEIGGEIKAQTQILSETITLLIDYTAPEGSPCPGAPTLTDVDGNTYNTVQIGNQCWMKENLRTTKYADSTPIALGSEASDDVAYRYAPDNNSSNVATYGYLYNWPAVMGYASSSEANPSGVQGICPTGWHVPSDNEWKQMEMAVGMSQSDANLSGQYRGNIAAKLCGNTGWNSSANANDAGNLNAPDRNSTGFSAFPAGCYYHGYYDGSYGDFGNDAYFWSATEFSSDDPYYRCLAYDNAGVLRNYYYIKPIGFSVRCVRDESVAPDSAALPTVTTNSVSNITEATATCGGNVAADGGATTVTARGVCWSTSQNPTVSDSHTTDGTGTGSFTSSITGLSAGTTYYVRAYATNSAGTAYGQQRSFTTTGTSSFTCGTSTLTDVDGNTYNTVQIGSQCWMKENLRTTKYADSTPIALGSEASYDVAYRYAPNYNNNNVATYGYLYNWPAVMGYASSSEANPSGVQGICPTGWHVPSDAEWTQLTDYVSSQSGYWCNGDSYYIAKALASTTGWYSSSTTCTVGNTPSSNNATGFSALPAGFYNGSYFDFGNYAPFWSATEYSSDNAYYHYLYNYGTYVSRFYNGKSYGYSVRCVRDASGTVSLPTVTTSNVTNITDVNATCGGNVTADGGATVTARGVCWSTSQNPTVSDSHTTDGSGTGSFTSSITGLSTNTTYYVRAYATNSAGTAYGEQRSFTTSAGGNPNDGQPCPDTPTLTDVDGNTYNTVLIGSQCWMKENLKTTKYADGTPIENGSVTSYDVAYWYYPNNVEANKATYGLLYNWKATMGDAVSTTANPSNVQGICPTGWHVPSDAEWTQLTDYVRSQSAYCCSGYTSNIAKALASTTGWNSYTGSNSDRDCYPGYNSSGNDATGFSALPAGYYYGSYYGFGDLADFWSATEFNSTVVDIRVLTYTNTNVTRSTNYKSDGVSVRCVRD